MNELLEETIEELEKQLAAAQNDARALAQAIDNAPNIRMFGDIHYGKMMTDELADALELHGAKYLEANHV